MTQQKKLRDQLKDLFSDVAVPEPAAGQDSQQEDAITKSTQIRGSESVEEKHYEPIQRVQIDRVLEQQAVDMTRLQALERQVASLEQTNSNLQNRSIYLEASEAIKRTVVSILEPRKLMHATMELIRDRFGFYHVSFFLLNDSGEWAIERAATGEVGRKRLTHPQRLIVGGESIVGWVCAHRRPRIARNLSADMIHHDNRLLPDTRSEVVLPLVVNDEVLGALDLHSTEENAFDDNDVHLLQGMADVVAVALQNARRFSETRRIAQQQQLVARVTDRMQRATTAADILILTLKELGETFDLAQAAICLGREAEFQAADHGPEPKANVVEAQHQE